MTWWNGWAGYWMEKWPVLMANSRFCDRWFYFCEPELLVLYQCQVWQNLTRKSLGVHGHEGLDL
jgi:hypothetical protein